jgi:hypothetical protein
MNTNYQSPARCSDRLPIRLPSFPVDERATYVESVCAVLIDSRFGPGRSSRILIKLSDWPEIEPAVLYELTPAGPVPSYSILPDSEIARRYSEAIIRDELSRLALEWAESRDNNAPTSNQGRGSPPL